MPELASLKTYLYNCVAMAKLNFVRDMKRMKRQQAHQCLPITNDCESDDSEVKDNLVRTINADSLADPRRFNDIIFLWAYKEFLDLLDADEMLALDYLESGYSQEETATYMGCAPSRFRRKILESLQMKAVFCGFEPHRTRSSES